MIPQLPSDTADFATLVQGPQYIYVDKTRWLAELFSPCALNSHLFLARPRRFGKTLLLSTAEALFQGRRDLFRNTWVGQEHRWDWKGRTRPVLRLNLDVRNRHTPQDVQAELTRRVRAQARRHHLPPLPVTHDAPPDAWLEETVYSLWEMAGRKVVVLVDEYDTALTENLDRPDVLGDILDVLRAFYGALKSSSDAGLNVHWSRASRGWPAPACSPAPTIWRICRTGPPCTACWASRPPNCRRRPCPLW